MMSVHMKHIGKNIKLKNEISSKLVGLGIHFKINNSIFTNRHHLISVLQSNKINTNCTILKPPNYPCPIGKVTSVTKAIAHMIVLSVSAAMSDSYGHLGSSQ